MPMITPPAMFLPYMPLVPGIHYIPSPLMPTPFPVFGPPAPPQNVNLMTPWGGPWTPPPAPTWPAPIATPMAAPNVLLPATTPLSQPEPLIPPEPPLTPPQPTLAPQSKPTWLSRLRAFPWPWRSQPSPQEPTRPLWA